MNSIKLIELVMGIEAGYLWYNKGEKKPGSAQISPVFDLISDLPITQVVLFTFSET